MVGHHYLAEAQSDGPTLWERMTTTWRGLLPAVADGAWVRRWSASGWAHRPAPDAQVFEEARRPDAAPAPDPSG